jgi:hypothetical protein
MRMQRALLRATIVACSLTGLSFIYVVATTPVTHFYGWYTFFQSLLAPTVGVVFLVLAAILACTKKLRTLR